MLAKAFAAARAIEQDETVSVRFAVDAIEIGFPDRLAAPNTGAAFELVSKELQPIARAVLGSAARFEHTSGSDPRRMLTLHLSGDSADLSAKIARLETL